MTSLEASYQIPSSFLWSLKGFTLLFFPTHDVVLVKTCKQCVKLVEWPFNQTHRRIAFWTADTVGGKSWTSLLSGKCHPALLLHFEADECDALECRLMFPKECRLYLSSICLVIDPSSGEMRDSVMGHIFLLQREIISQLINCVFHFFFNVFFIFLQNSDFWSFDLFHMLIL